MTVRELQLLVKEGEHTTLEFKRKVAHPEKIVKEIVAFANTRGGNLLIGVNDDGNLTGLKFPDEDAYMLEREINRLCRPAIEYQREYIAISDKKTIVRYFIPESSQKPHHVVETEVASTTEINNASQSLQNKKVNGQVKKSSSVAQLRKRAYFRVNDRSIQASRELREILRRQRKQRDIRFSWGEREQQLVQYLSEHQSITVKEFARLAGIRPYQASRTLVLLVLGNVLKIIPAEIEDKFVMKENT
ncbi:AlbA family DNA-binding domain-containing protein [Nafulsella turpanensis]|uniref:AlbA family DNA-binding domain-containing protein n=1 Tax=Nafulsella turpanensis TaxID=1265690 RepID=UPI000344F58A|nr:ATP-binding protein [Nafulsella turpanensis]